MTPLEKLIRAAMEYVESVQNNPSVAPTVEVLMFCGTVHGVINDGTAILQKQIIDNTPFSFTFKV